MQMFGRLNSKNIVEVAEKMRAILANKIFAIASSEYSDSGHAEVKLVTDAKFIPDWTPYAINKYKIEPNEPILCDVESINLSFSAGGYFWSFHGNDNPKPDEHVPYFCIEHNSVKWESMAPAGKGYLHKHMFKVQSVIVP